MCKMPTSAKVSGRAILDLIAESTENELQYAVLREAKDHEGPYMVFFDWDHHKLKSIKIVLIDEP